MYEFLYKVVMLFGIQLIHNVKTIEMVVFHNIVKNILARFKMVGLVGVVLGF